MNLWIRSQDKEKIVKCNDIAIATDTEDGKTIRGYKIVGYFDKQTEYEELGFYTLHSRALEVLDEIQNIIKEKDIITNCKGLLSLVNNKSLDGANKILERIEEIAVYEMPKE